MASLALQHHQPPAAQESIAACRALFNGQQTRGTLKEFYNRLEPKQRGLILIAAGLPARDYERHFEEFDDIELEKIRKGMQFIKQMSVNFDNQLGDVRRLKHYQFSNTH
ncbi:hypothetical protein K7V76_002483 [Vibrio fluvialis]|nr:hypothetical protein [Vibrio fluvialis]EKO3528267.1 hypothetical protein [Vibrio fluvialis]